MVGVVLWGEQVNMLKLIGLTVPAPPGLSNGSSSSGVSPKTHALKQLEGILALKPNSALNNAQHRSRREYER